MTTVPLVVLGFLFIGAYVLSVLLDPPSLVVDVAVTAVLVAAWLAFAADYVVRLALTPSGGRWDFVVHNVVDLLSVILPVFRAIRVINLLRRIPYFHSRTPAAVRTEIVCYALAYVVLFVFFIALATLQAEREAQGATITDLGQARHHADTTADAAGPRSGALRLVLLVGVELVLRIVVRVRVDRSGELRPLLEILRKPWIGRRVAQFLFEGTVVGVRAEVLEVARDLRVLCLLTAAPHARPPLGLSSRAWRRGTLWEQG